MDAEDPEQRRARLQALRTEAAAPTPSSAVPPPPSSSLSNPLANPQSPPPPGSAASGPARFDFYTDPMAAYTGTRQRTAGGRGGNNQHAYSDHGSAGPRNYHMATPPAQFQMNQSPDQSPYGNQQHAYQSSQWRSPLQFASPNKSPYGTPQHAPQSSEWRGTVQFGPPGESLYGTPQHAPPSSQWRNPVPFGSPISAPGANPPASPGSWNRSGGSSGHAFPQSSHMSPNFGRGDSPMNSYGRGSPMHNFGGGSPMSNSSRGSAMNHSGRVSPHSYSGRGNNMPYGSNASPGQGRGRGRGRGPNGQRIAKSYKAMLKDPWRKLKPVVGNILVPLPTDWLPKSLAVKKAKTEASGSKNKSQPNLPEWLPQSLSVNKSKTEESKRQVSSMSNLAECLALSFEETINEGDT